MSISEKALKTLTEMQQNEVDEHEIYKNIASFVKDEKDRATLNKIAEDEASHAKVWEGYTNRKCTPRRLRVWWYTLIARILGYTFALKKMESGEDRASDTYRALINEIPEAERIVDDEEKHENELLDMLDEERLQYVGAMVLGLNDALVELTGTLAGMAFALQNNRLVALSGLITGVSATFSMTASSYLSAKSDQDPNAVKTCTYTGIMYLITVVLLVLPYLLLPAESFVAALVVMMFTVALIILAFNYYISVAKSLNFKERFLEMLVISGSVAILSFAVGLAVKAWLGIDI